jgi:hypothetical protein
LQEIFLRAKLHVAINDGALDYSVGRRFRLAVVDFDMAKEYPVNFVCLLPTRLGSVESKASKFSEVLGDESLDVAKKLLTEALKKEDDVAIISEIERRLRLLDPERFKEKKCVSCGRMFQVDAKKRFKQKFCEDCIKKKFGGRE